MKDKVLTVQVREDVLEKWMSGEGGGSSGGGGADLEGEYFLAKPNGRYWKFTFSPDYYYIDPKSLDTEQLESLELVYEQFELLSVIYGAAVCNAGIPSDYELRVDGVGAIGARISEMLNILSEMLNESAPANDYRFNSSFFRVWQECDIKCNPSVEIPDMGGLSLNSYNWVEFIKIIYAMVEGSELTDDEAISLIEQMLMLIPATEEEYKEARREN